MKQEPCGCSFRPGNTLGAPELCLTDRKPELVEISPWALSPELSGLPGLFLRGKNFITPVRVQFKMIHNKSEGAPSTACVENAPSLLP